ncbi:GNAT family N-acetyltransferase [Maritalea sp. S77]|uniref:GNAT family N-acetyltransferase n=1 Tax=Maritalea sp. S77 TaxID=3415125 RepID=UPI003C7EBDBB
MHADLALCWRVEEACQLAWPSLHAQNICGYVFRYSGSNRSRRANSFNPINGPRLQGEEFIAQAESFFDHFQMRPCFRMPEIGAELDNVLAENGYAREAETITLFAPDLTHFNLASKVDISTENAPESWLNFYFSLAEEDGQQQQVFSDMLGKIALPVAYGEAKVDGRIGAIAYVVLVGDLAIIEAVATDPKYRRQGLAANVVGSLLAWARAQGCTEAALQVVAENAPATNLYAKLGFSTELYRYHYRTK